MSASPLEVALVQHLFRIDGIEYLVAEGLPEEIIPTAEVRQVWHYAVDYFYSSMRTSPLTAEAVQTFDVAVGVSMADLLDDLEVSYLQEPEINVADVVKKLRANYAHREVAKFNRDFAQAMADATTDEKVAVARGGATELVRLVQALETRRSKVDVRSAVADVVRAYERRRDMDDVVDGMRFGLARVDDHMLCIHPGELAMIAAFAKVGKSFWMINTALAEWRRGRAVALFTLENSIEMTLDRLCCVACSVDASAWQRGECSEAEVDRVHDFARMLGEGATPLYVLQPSGGSRTAEAIVRQAQVLEVDSLLIDQLSFMEHPDPGRKPRHEIVRDIMHDLRVGISAYGEPLPCLLAHQINREGKKAADKIGHHLMDHLAESSETERTVDMAYSLYQSDDARNNDLALLQVLAARRFAIKWWNMLWSPGQGVFRVRNEQAIRTGDE